MNYSKLKLRVTATALPIILSCFAASAQTVDWGTDATLDPNAAILSDGSTMSSSLTWTLGYFSGGFVPTASNYAMWAANYVAVDTNAWKNDGSGVYSVPGHIDDVGAAAAGNVMYTFAFNNLSLLGTSDGEALLYRQDGLLFPTVPNQTTFQIVDGPNSTDDALTVIWGTVDRNIYGSGGLITGGGYVTAAAVDSTAGTFTAQTGSWAPVPEPSSALLMLIGGAAIMRRSRRKR